MSIDLTSIDDPEDPRIAEAADEVINGLRGLIPSMGPEVAAAVFDAIAERLDVLIDEVEEQLEDEADEEDEVDEVDEDLLSDPEDS